MVRGCRLPSNILAVCVAWATCSGFCAAQGPDGGLLELPPSGLASRLNSVEAETQATEVVYEGTPRPGSRVVIGPDGPFAPGTSFAWEQVEGPPVAVDDPAAAKIAFVVPQNAPRLAFLLTMRDPEGERKSRVVIPIAAAVTPATDAAAAAEPGASRADDLELSAADLPAPGPQADAGDDQIGLVDRRITLNGGRSRPEGQLGYRWIKLAGPAIEDPRQEGSYYSFVPTAPGLYKFALVVGHQSQVSQPDEVTVEVGQRPTAETSSPVGRWIGLLLPSIPQGYETAGRVAEIFEAIGQRAPLYSSYSELQSELNRRLQEVIPQDPTLHGVWANQVFGPLSQLTGTEMLAVGVDLRSPAALVAPLDVAQKQRIQTYYQGLAGAFRSRLTNP